MEVIFHAKTTQIFSLNLFHWGHSQHFPESLSTARLGFSSYTAPLKSLRDTSTVSLTLVLPTAPCAWHRNRKYSPSQRRQAVGPWARFWPQKWILQLTHCFLKVLQSLIFKNVHRGLQVVLKCIKTSNVDPDQPLPVSHSGREFPLSDGLGGSPPLTCLTHSWDHPALEASMSVAPVTTAG